MSRHPFAPGAIERHSRGPGRQRCALVRWLLVCAIVMALGLAHLLGA